MKSRTLTCISATTLLATLALPAQLAAQHTRYKFIDIGTLGGPVSYGSVNGEGNQILNNSGVIASSADTSIPDPNAPDFCFNPHPDGFFVTHAIRWKNGTLTDLGALLGLNPQLTEITLLRLFSPEPARENATLRRLPCQSIRPAGSQ